MALSLVKTCTKVGLSGGAIYWSVQQGVWGTSQEGCEAMKRLTDTILPTEPVSATKTPPPPVMKPSDSMILSGWNKGAKTIFECIRDAPDYAGKAKSSVTKLVNESLGN